MPKRFWPAHRLGSPNAGGHIRVRIIRPWVRCYARSDVGLLSLRSNCGLCCGFSGSAGRFLGGETTPEVIGTEGTRFRNQRPRGVHLVPRVPQQNPTHSAAVEIIDDAFAVGLFPVGHLLEPRVQLAHGFVPQLEEIGIEVWEMMIWFGVPGHSLSCCPPHCVGIVFVLDADALAQRRIVEGRNITSRVNVWMTRAQRFIDDDAAIDLEPRCPRQGYVWLDAQSRDHPVDVERLPALSLHDALSSSLLNPN